MFYPNDFILSPSASIQAQVFDEQISVMLADGLYDHYILRASILAPEIELGDETYFRTEEVAKVKVKDRFGKRLESYRIYRKGGSA